MSGLADFDFREVYEASCGDLVDEFYVPALDRAARYDRAVGYFRSTIFHLVGIALSEFALRDGRMRLICSPSVSKEDEETIRRVGRTSEQQLIDGIGSDIELAMQDLKAHSTIQLLATLMEHDILDLQLVYKPAQPGIFHTKVGIFREGESAVSFSGSANETFMAWAANEERFQPFCSWRSDYQARQVERDQDYFDRLWRSELSGFETRPLPDVCMELLKTHALPDPQAAVEGVRLAFGGAQRISKRGRAPTWTLQKHQADSKVNWWLKRRGIVCYVTGGGKTITALEIINDWFERVERGSVIVLVPSSLLAKQWSAHLALEDPTLTVLQVGGDESNPRWRRLLGLYTRSRRVGQRRVVLAVMNSAATSDFISKAQVSEGTLLIADEVHKVGAPHLRRVLQLDAGGRLGLSATPERFGDPDGTDAIFEYFGARLEPAFTIQDAQRANPPRLVPYTYHPHTVALTSGEMARYRKLSQQVAQLTARAQSSGDSSDQAHLNLALIRRAKILKSAVNKIDLGLEIIRTRYNDGDRWLVYCDDTSQLNSLRERLIESGLRPLQYYSAMAFSKDATIQRFTRLGGVLLSINCLDEGIDIPSITHALILASSMNPRQHLQRRGRVLRTAEGKDEATIYDTLVQPDQDDPDVIFDQDLDRAYEFGADADNHRMVTRKLGGFSRFSGPEASSWTDFEDDIEDVEEDG
jgi:superfamily II DNA or RNA helicase